MNSRKINGSELRDKKSRQSTKDLQRQLVYCSHYNNTCVTTNLSKPIARITSIVHSNINNKL